MSDPIWLEGGDAVLPVAPERPVVWLLDLADAAVRAMADSIPVLPGEAETFARHPDAGERLLRRRFARHLLASAAGRSAAEVRIDADAVGAPRVTAPAGWHLSVAARWPACAIAIARVTIGIDVEVATTPLPDDLLTRRERAAVAILTPDERPLAGAAMWAAKEAHAKWTRRPRALDPATVETCEVGFVGSPLGRSRCWSQTAGRLALALCADD